MNLTQFYNHDKFMQSVKAAEKSICFNSGNEIQLFRVGDSVISSENSCFNLFVSDNAKVIKAESVNGFYRYTVKFGKFERIFRQIDLMKI